MEVAIRTASHSLTDIPSSSTSVASPSPVPPSPRRTAIARLRAEGALEAVNRVYDDDSIDNDKFDALIESYKKPIERELIGDSETDSAHNSEEGADSRSPAHLNREFQRATGALQALRLTLRDATPALARLHLDAVMANLTSDSPSHGVVAQFYEPGRLRRLDDQLPQSRGFALLEGNAIERITAEDIAAEFSRRSTALEDVPAERRTFEFRSLLTDANSIAEYRRTFALEPLFSAVRKLPPSDQNSAHATLFEAGMAVDPGVDRSALLAALCRNLAGLTRNAIAPAILRATQFIATFSMGERPLGLTPLIDSLSHLPAVEAKSTAIEVLRAGAYLPISDATPIINAALTHIATAESGNTSAANQEFLRMRLRKFESLDAMPDGVRVAEVLALSIAAARFYQNNFGRLIARILPQIQKLPDAPQANALYTLLRGVNRRPLRHARYAVEILTGPITALPTAHRGELLTAYVFVATDSADGAAVCAPHFPAILRSISGIAPAQQPRLLHSSLAAMRRMPRTLRDQTEPAFVATLAALPEPLRDACAREIIAASQSGIRALDPAECRLRRRLRNALEQV